MPVAVELNGLLPGSGRAAGHWAAALLRQAWAHPTGVHPGGRPRRGGPRSRRPDAGSLTRLVRAGPRGGRTLAAGAPDPADPAGVPGRGAAGRAGLALDS